MKTNYLPLIVFLLIANVAVSQDIAYSEKLIDKVERIKLSNVLQSKKGTAPKRSISPYLMEAKKNWSRLTSNARSYFSSVRPVLTGTEVIFLSVYFDIHYTISGADAVDTTDIDANGTPDYVEDMAIEADNVYLKDSLRGFTMPPPDAGDGGSNYDDIYIFDLEPGVYGYVEPENNIGDNPNSPGITELSSTTSYVAMRNDYSGFMGDELDNIKATLAHEFSHAIDFGYSEDFSLFFLESKGPWEEQKLYPSITDNYQYLPNIFSYPDVALDWSDYDGTNGVEYDQHWYAGWIFLKYITEHTNDDIILAFLTRGITDSDELSFIDDELDANWNSDFSTMFGNWLIANIVMDSDPAYEPYTYANADAYGTYIGANGDQYVEDEFTYTGTAISWESDVDGNSRLMR
ncbi:MAG: hypothetical protein IH946_08155 [Bacteroidetes bacterium]|nr:hypothetical protein [Bacteroidota bacterium]